MNHTIARACLAVVALSAAAGRAHAAADVRVELRVTSAAGSAVYVDRGTSGGLAAGDRVEFRLESGVVASGIVRSAGVNGARVELDPGSERPPVGARGEALVPDDRPGAHEPHAADGRSWTHPPETWSSDKPLLAPAFGLAPEDRPARWHGRAWTRFDATLDRAGDRTYGLAAIGTDATLENPFGDGGALRIDVEAFARRGDVDDDDGLHDYDDARVRVDRLAYDVGGTEDRPHRFVLGRFQQTAFPDLGPIDGAEWSVRTRGGTLLGASFGFMPEPFADRSSFDDLQAAVFARQEFGADGRASVGVAYQNTWHAGEQDRNLFLLDAVARPTDRLALRASAWVDVYGPSDTIKDDGPELTEARAAATWTGTDGGGLSAFVAQRRIPELLRDEFLARRADDVANEVVDRAGLGAWTRAGRDVRVDARLDAWQDQDDQGFTAELGATLDEAFGTGSALTGAVAWADGSYSSGPGARISARRAFGESAVGLGWNSTWYSQKDFGGDDDEIAQHAAFATFDTPLFGVLDLSLVLDRSFGDDVDAWSAGLRLQFRF